VTGDTGLFQDDHGCLPGIREVDLSAPVIQ